MGRGFASRGPWWGPPFGDGGPLETPKPEARNEPRHPAALVDMLARALGLSEEQREELRAEVFLWWIDEMMEAADLYGDGPHEGPGGASLTTDDDIEAHYSCLERAEDNWTGGSE